MPDLATLDVRIDSRDAKKELAEIRSEAKKTQDAAHGKKRTSTSATQRAAKSMKRQADAAANLRKQLSRLESLDFKNLSPEQWNQTKRSISGVSSSIARSYKEGRIAKKEFAELSDNLSVLRDRFNNLTERQAEWSNKSKAQYGQAAQGLKNWEKAQEKARQSELKALKEDIVHRHKVAQSYEEADAAAQAYNNQLQKNTKPIKKTISESAKLKQEMGRLEKLDFENISPKQFKKTGSAIESLSTSMNRMYRQGKISLEQYNKLDARLGTLQGSYDEYTREVNKSTSSNKKNLTILGDLWKSFDKGTGAILRQVQLWGLLSAVLIGVQAAYAALGVVATRAGVTLRENAHQLNMNVQALQELQFAATSVGVSVQDLRDGLGEMSTSIVDAVKGQKAAKEAFEDLDISISTLINKGNDTNAMFDKVISRLENVDSATKRLSIARDIFGETAGRQALKFINRMEEARNVVDQFHGSLSDDLARSAAEVWNKIRLIWTALKGQFIKAAAEATDTIGGLADEILRAAKQGNVFKGTLIPAIRVTANVIKGLIPVGEFLYSTINTIAQNFWYVAQAAKALIGLHLGKIMGKITSSIGAATTATSGLSKAFAALKATVSGLLKMTGYYLIVEAIFTLIGAVRKLNKIVSVSELSFEMAAKVMMEKFINNTIDGLETWWDRIKTAVEKVVNYIPRKMGEAGSSALEAFTGAWEDYSKTAKSEDFQKRFMGNVPGPWESVKQSISNWWSGESPKKIPRTGVSGKTYLSASPAGPTEDQEGSGDLFGGDAKVELASDKARKKYNKAMKELSKGLGDIKVDTPELRDADRLPSRLDTSTLLRHFEDINTKFGSFYDKVKDLVSEGKKGEAEDYVPFAKKEIQNKIGQTKAKLETTRTVLDTIQKTSHPTAGKTALGVDPEKIDSARIKTQKLEGTLSDLREKMEKLRSREILGENWLGRVTDALRKYANDATTTADEIAGAFTTGFQTIEDKMVNFMDTGKFKWREMLTSMANDINRILIRKSITGPLAKAIGGEGGSGGFAGFLQESVKGMFSSSASSGGGYFSGGSTAPYGVGARASGGSVSANGTYVVGERGPELLHMGNQSGNVTPNNQIKGGDTEIHIHEAPQGTQVKRSKKSGGGERIDVMMDRQMADNIGKGGETAQMLETKYGLSPNLASR